jgi:hypothetical protein
MSSLFTDGPEFMSVVPTPYVRKLKPLLDARAIDKK